MRFSSVSRFLVPVITLCVVSSIKADPPDIIEDFTNFTGIFGSSTESPTDTGSLWNVVGGGSPSTVQGFRPDGGGFHGNCMTWNGAETKAIFQDQNFSTGVPAAHQIAFTVSFSAASGDPADRDFVQVFGDVPLDANLLSLNITSYVVSVGKLNTAEQGIIVQVPVTPLGIYQEILIPAPADQFNKVVIQYEPASTLLSLDAKIKVWVNPADGSASPNIDIAPGLIGSFFGNAGLGRFAMGNSTPAVQPRPGQPIVERAGSSTVKVDTIGGWYGTSEARAGSLNDAIAFFDSFTPSSVSHWESY